MPGGSNGQAAGGSSLRAQTDPPDAPGDPNVSSASVDSGKQLSTTLGCAGCHTTNGKGGLAGPDLSNEPGKGRSREWLATEIRNPKADNPQAIMPAYPALLDDDIDDLVNYLLSLPAAGAPTAATGARTAQGVQMAPAASASPLAIGGKMW